MKKVLGILLLISTLIACKKTTQEIPDTNPTNWKERYVDLNGDDTTMVPGKTYLSVYSQVYSHTEHRKHNLTATVSMRNTSYQDTIYVVDANYYDTHGDLIRSYFEKTIFIAPMETVEIVIDENDVRGGTGGNFMFHWLRMNHTTDPIFEAVMISTSGQQGLSFTTQGVWID